MQSRRTVRCEMGGELSMKLIVGYLSTPGGADAMALGARLARTLGAEVEACIILPHEQTHLTGTRDYEARLGHQAEKWLAEAVASVPDDVGAHSHATFDESFADGLIRETARLEADLIVVGGSGGGLAGSYSLGSVVNELLHSAPVPVVVTPRGTRDSKSDKARICCWRKRFGSARLPVRRCGWFRWWRWIRCSARCAATTTPSTNAR